MIRDAIEKKIVTFVTLRLTPPNLTKNTMYFLRETRSFFKGVPYL